MVTRGALFLIVGVMLIASVSVAVLVAIPLTARTQIQTVTIQAPPITTTTTSYVSVSFTVNVTVSPASASSDEQLNLEKYRWDLFNVTDATGATIEVNLITLGFQNVGSVPISLAQSTVSVGGIPAPQPSANCGETISPGSDCIYSFTPPDGDWVVGSTYTLQLVEPDGTAFSYSIVAGGGSY